MFDVDGVLNEHGGIITRESKDAINLLRKKQIRVGFCSGKHAWYIQGGLVWSGLLKDDTIIVAENGGVVFNPKSRKTFIVEDSLKDVKLLRSIFFNLYSRNNGFINFAGLNVWEEPKETMFCLYPQNLKAVDRLASTLKEIVVLNKLNLYIIKNPDSVDVVQKGVNKATGLIKACEWTGVNIENVIAFGDSYNDIEMLETVGFAIAVGNARREIKKLVSSRKTNGYVCQNSFGLGVKEALRQLFENGFI